MPKKVPFHYPIILAGITLIMVALMVAAGGSTLIDETPTVDIAGLSQQHTTVAENTAEAVVNTDIPSTAEPTSIPTSEPTTEVAVEATTEPVEATEVASTTDETDSSTENADTAVQYDPALVQQGETIYNSLCFACHGVGARGIEGLGKDLVASEFVAKQTDEELLTFVKTGRPIWDAENTTGVDMPPKGGNPALTDDEIVAVIAYIRTEEAKLAGTTEHEVDSSIQDSSANPEDSTAADGTDESTSPSAVEFDALLAEEGEMIFLSLCSACHGPGAVGIEGLGKPLVGSEFVQTHTNDELLDFVKTGRPIWDAENTTGVDMPPRGGNPALTDEQIIAVIHYIRSIDQ